MQQVTIFREPGRYAGWPANFGIWSWGDEIVVGFTVGSYGAMGRFHKRDKSQPFVNVQARSLDGGQSWQVEPFPGFLPEGRGVSADEHMLEPMWLGNVIESAWQAPPGGIDFTQPDFAWMGARAGLHGGGVSFFYTSADRARSWEGPYRLPLFGQTGVAARTDYLVEDARRCLFFLTANKANEYEGRVMCARTSDGGASFEFVAFIGDEPEPGGFAIMPASLRLPGGRILAAVRCRAGDRKQYHDVNWIDLYTSDDDGATWQHMNRPVEFRDKGHNGSPPTLNALPDGRIVLVYGNRDQPFTMAARLSADGGTTWSDEITLRTGGGNHDIGYPRTVVRPDGTVVTVYYFNEHAEGDRFIEATLWKPEP